MGGRSVGVPSIVGPVLGTGWAVLPDGLGFVREGSRLHASVSENKAKSTIVMGFLKVMIPYGYVGKVNSKRQNDAFIHVRDRSLRKVNDFIPLLSHISMCAWLGSRLLFPAKIIKKTYLQVVQTIILPGADRVLNKSTSPKSAPSELDPRINKKNCLSFKNLIFDPIL